MNADEIGGALLACIGVLWAATGYVLGYWIAGEDE